jgi:Co/Zn/Cd efflux system component
MEPEEISEFAKRMREAGEESMTRVSLIISTLAVLVALVTVLSHREHTEAVLNQARASDRWAEYQGRRTRLAQEQVAERMLNYLPGGEPATRQAEASQSKSEQGRIEAELTEDAQSARELEAEVAKAEHKAARLDVGEALLQISVVLASVTLLTRQWRYVLAAVALGLAGIIAASAALLVR